MCFFKRILLAVSRSYSNDVQFSLADVHLRLLSDRKSVEM
jgi:hypothetical protein